MGCHDDMGRQLRRQGGTVTECELPLIPVRVQSIAACSLLNSQLKKQVENACLVVSLLWSGPDNIHDFFL